jgi:hypothetical protein
MNKAMNLAISRTLLVFSLIFAPLFFSVESIAEEISVLIGKVTDVEGNPVEGAVIFLYQSSGTRRQPDFASQKTDGEGRVSITLPPGRYWAVARVKEDEEMGPVPAGGKHSGEPAEINLTGPGDIETEFIVADIREIARMSAKTRHEVSRMTGRILDTDGTPVKMAYAFANRVGNSPGIPDYLSTWTDETGYYNISLPPGRYLVGSSVAYPPEKNGIREVNIESDLSDVDFIIDKSQGP